LTALLLLFIAPVFQIILLTLKIRGRINPPAGVIAILTFILGITLSIVSMNLVESDIHPNPIGPKCGTILAAFLFAGFFITAVATPIIELIFFAINRFIRKGNSSTTEAV
jgi:hypothetical protein